MSRATSKQRGAEQFSPPVNKRKTSFFKIIHGNIIADQQLVLPTKFVTKHGNEFSDNVTLKVPNGSVWTIKLNKDDGKICLCAGWKDFVEYHSIHAGHVLIFRYDGKSCFYVIICDMTTVEINYPSETVNKLEKATRAGKILTSRQNLGSKTELEDDDDVQILNVRANRDDADTFKSRYPFFKISMNASYLSRKFMNIPVEFCKNYLPKGLESLTLEVSNGRKKCRVRCLPVCSQNRGLRMRG
ncbi:hypothetical protein AQUCO_01000343v1 [Aquilegia coerulea]|uniref:TF-B3 domain-containing protein n=1 Tax=Aquilegia coerulea TaxID=218851 RepID=A0A2G5EA27_AQUCA|nr:hypothetical protein AQUCO_01000343v1 [Aquilegia coerulea]